MIGIIKRMIKQETVLCVAAVLAVLSMAAVPPSAEYLTYPDYKTLALLFLATIVKKDFPLSSLPVIGKKFRK